MAPECQAKNREGLAMVAIGVNKAADQYLLLDERTKDELASGKFADQRRGSFGTSVASPDPAPTARTAQPVRRRRDDRRRPPAPARRPWTKSQEKLALLYNEQGLRPDEIAQKLGLGPYTVSQIILALRNRGKL
jgi:DNA-binding CsgD family transcriptional regulator